MKRIKWWVSMGMQGCEKSDVIEVEDEATPEDIEAIVREEVFQHVEYGSYAVDDDDKPID